MLVFVFQRQLATATAQLAVQSRALANSESLNQQLRAQLDSLIAAHAELEEDCIQVLLGSR